MGGREDDVGRDERAAARLGQGEALSRAKGTGIP